MNHRPEDFASAQEVERAWLALQTELDIQLPNERRKRFFWAWFTCSFLALAILTTYFLSIGTKSTLPAKKSVETPSTTPQPQKNIPIANNLNKSEPTINTTQGQSVQMLPPFVEPNLANLVTPSPTIQKTKNTPGQFLAHNENPVSLNDADTSFKSSLQTSAENHFDLVNKAHSDADIDNTHTLNNRLNNDSMPPLNLDDNAAVADLALSINYLTPQTAQIQSSQYEPQDPIKLPTLTPNGFHLELEAGALYNVLANFGGYVQAQLTKTLGKKLAISAEVRLSGYKLQTDSAKGRALAPAPASAFYSSASVEKTTDYNVKMGLSAAYKFKRIGVEMPMGYIYAQNLSGFYTGLGIKYRLNKSLNLSSRYLANTYFSEYANFEHQVSIGLSYRI